MAGKSRMWTLMPHGVADGPTNRRRGAYGWRGADGRVTYGRFTHGRVTYGWAGNHGSDEDLTITPILTPTRY